MRIPCSRFLREDFPVFRRTAVEIVGDFAVFRPISTPGFVGWWQQAGWIRPLQALLANITPPITAISYYISITLGGKKHIVLRSGKYNREVENTTVLLVWKLFFCPSQPSPRTDRRTLPKEFNTPTSPPLTHSHSASSLRTKLFQSNPKGLWL